MNSMLLKAFWEMYLCDHITKDWNKILVSFLIFVWNSSSDSTFSQCMLDTSMRIHIYKICWYVNHLRSLVLIISKGCSQGKLCFTQFSKTIYWNRDLTAFDFFDMFTQSIKFCPFHCHISKGADVNVWNGWFIK